MRQRRKGTVVVGIVCLFNLKGKEYSIRGVLPIGSLWRISWLAFRTWSSIWAAPACQGRQQECEHGFGLLEWSCHPYILVLYSPLRSPKMGLKSVFFFFFVRTLGREEGSVVPKHEGVLNWHWMDPGGSRRTDLFLEFWRAELESPRQGKGCHRKQRTSYSLLAKWDSLSTIINWLAAGREALIFKICPISVA